MGRTRLHLLVGLAVMVSAHALAQKTGGSIGGTQDTPSGSGHVAPSSSSRDWKEPTFDTRPSTNGPSDFDKRRERDRVELERAASDRRRAENERSAAEWNRLHRNAGRVALTQAEYDQRVPEDYRISRCRWPALSVGALVFVLLLLPAFRRRASRQVVVPRVTRSAAPSQPARATVAQSSTRLVRLTLGFDPTARAAIQQGLQQLARSAFDSPESRRQRVAELMQLFEPHLTHVEYATLVERELSLTDAEGQLETLRRELEARYETKTRGEQAHERNVTPLAHEGAGFLVVSLVATIDASLDDRLATWRPLRRVVTRLQRLSKVGSVRIVWSPAEETDRMSSAELEALYPELERVGERALGRVACLACDAIYAAELGACPACGFKTPAQAPAAASAPCPYCGTGLPINETKCETCGAWVKASG